MSMLSQNEIRLMTEGLNAASDMMWKKTIEATGTVTLTTEERRAAWNALQYALRLLSVVVPMQSDLIKSLKLLDAEGVWTGADDLLHDRVQHLILDRNGHQRSSEGWEQIARNRGEAIMPFVREFTKEIEETAETDPDTAMEMFQYNLTIGDVYNLLLSVKGDRELWNDAT